MCLLWCVSTKIADWHCWIQGSMKGISSNPVPVEKHNIRGFVSCPDVSCLSFLFSPPFFPFCSCCWICPPFRWLVAMLLSSLCSLALWWIVYGFPSSILHFCIDGLGFQWVLRPVGPQKTCPAPPFWSSNWECCKWAPCLFNSNPKSESCLKSSSFRYVTR